MTRRSAWVLLALLIGVGVGSIPATARAEGAVFFGGYGYDHPGCGLGTLPCGTYDYAGHQACNLSENEQDTYHVFHAYDGYISSCDMVGGSGREQQGGIERDWFGLWQSTFIPTLIMTSLTFAICWLCRRRRIVISA